MYTWEIFQAAYQAATPEQKAVIDADIIPPCVSKIIASQQLDQAHFKKLVRLYALYVLGSIAEQAIEQEMLRLGIPEGKMLFAALRSCQAETPNSTPDLDSLAADIASTEAALQQPPAPATPIRTMAADMQQAQTTTDGAEPVYTSTQSAILQERTTTPTPAKAAPVPQPASQPTAKASTPPKPPAPAPTPQTPPAPVSQPAASTPTPATPPPAPTTFQNNTPRWDTDSEK